MSENSNWEFEVISVSGNEALSKIEELHQNLPNSKKYPFIIGEERDLEILTDVYEEDEKQATKIIEKSLTLNIQEIFEDRKNDLLPIDEEFDSEAYQKEITGIWEYKDSPMEIGLTWEDFISSYKDSLSQKSFEKCYIGIAPTNESWQIPAFTRFGNWNSCPSPEEHCAILRYWQEKYGAKIISQTFDVIECSVEKPPQTEEECWELAWQQYYYCSDIVDQGVGDVGKLASGLRDSSYWYFWWD